MKRTYFCSVLRKPSLISSVHLLRFFNNKCGVIIGGHLRWHFKSLIETAQKIINVDNCPSNLEGHIEVDYVTDAANLSFATDGSQDFVCSSHVLEHLANPLKAIAEWKRVIKEKGIICVGVPDKRHIFDHKRQRTPLSHLIDDFEKDVDQTDKTHISDFLENWDEEGVCCDSREQLTEHVRDGLESRVHHHVWIVDDLKEIFEYMDLRIVYGPILHHGTIYIIGRK
ncbi:MAG: class I SAM-dependent methyltransferase [Desulfobacterales bacterium]|nr:class I SAM-dependent methyltransferase [Desulfobacterales bacterium]